MKALYKREEYVSSGRKMMPKKFMLIILSAGMLLLSSCYEEIPWRGSDGRPGTAYLALTWIDDEPSYINAGTASIPGYFYWDEYYRATPGYYTLYYEGDIRMGNNWSSYAWEIEYEIWRMEGEKGDLYYHGRDGEDTYFTLECSPFGPMVYEDFKNTAVDYEVLQQSPDEVTILKSKNDFKLKITYRKAEKRNHEAGE